MSEFFKTLGVSESYLLTKHAGTPAYNDVAMLVRFIKGLERSVERRDASLGRAQRALDVAGVSTDRPEVDERIRELAKDRDALLSARDAIARNLEEARAERNAARAEDYAQAKEQAAKRAEDWSSGRDRSGDARNLPDAIRAMEPKP